MLSYLFTQYINSNISFFSLSATLKTILNLITVQALLYIRSAVWNSFKVPALVYQKDSPPAEGQAISIKCEPGLKKVAL